MNWNDIDDEEDLLGDDDVDFLAEDTPTSTQEAKPVEPEIKPVAMGKKKVGAIVIAFLVFCIIVVMSLQRCSISKEIKNGSESETSQTDIEGPSKTPTITGENTGNGTENPVATEEPNSSGGENNNTTGNQGNVQPTVSVTPDITKEPVKDITVTPTLSENTGNTGGNNYQGENNGNSSGGLEKVTEPALGEVRESTAMVSSKSVYRVDNVCYVYSINLILLIGTDSTVTLTYFCPRVTYDAVAIGDSLNVAYQTDSFGVVSISSLSK